ncbi:hypothetical protein PMAYCL1PPCAC_24858, partial [Pristionchus mayeri]
RKMTVSGTDYLSVILACSENKTRLWSLATNIEYLLLNSDWKKNKSYKESAIFQRNCSHKGYGMSKWEDIINEKEDDKITVEIRFKITSMRGFRAVPIIDFGDSNEPCHDVTLVIGGEKINASKQYLSLHSPVFKSMFFGEFVEKDKKEIELNDINREEFLEMLRVIYPSHKKITDDNVSFFLKLGDRFQIKFLLDLAEDYLISSAVPELASKLILSDQCRLVNLQEHCLSSLTTSHQFTAIKGSPIYRDLS